MSHRLLKVYPRRYVDSVRLMAVSSALQSLTGVESAAAVMATGMNKAFLANEGFDGNAMDSASSEDLLVGIQASSEATAESALAELENLMKPRQAEGDSSVADARSINSAVNQLDSPNLAVIAVPGEHASLEAWSALRRGLNLFIFSDNVPIEDEVRLKQEGLKAGLLVMGPDCGTAILAGVGLGFANRVRRGSIGLVGASGTGIQQVSSLIHYLGGGVAQAIGTGSRDLTAEVQGMMTMAAVDLLAADESVKRIGLISKPSDPAVARKVVERLARCGKPSAAFLLGAGIDGGGVQLAGNLTDLAHRLTESVDQPPLSTFGRAGSNRKLAGVYCGGTLCQEAQDIALTAGVDSSRFIDAGADEYTRGRAHPMIDPRLRASLIEQAGATADVIIFDVVLGDLSHPDPAPHLEPALQEARSMAAQQGRDLQLFAALIGTDLDPQGFERQKSILESCGVKVSRSNAEAAFSAVQAVIDG